jgi:hypothetical protein
MASELAKMPNSHTLVDNEGLGCHMQNTMTSEVQFRTLLAESGAERLELARA